MLSLVASLDIYTYTKSKEVEDHLIHIPIYIDSPQEDR
jgi:hypothetical protein